MRNQAWTPYKISIEKTRTSHAEVIPGTQHFRLFFCLQVNSSTSSQWYPFRVYFTPEMVAALSTLTKLETMRLLFGYPDFDSDLEGPAQPPLTRSVLPALKRLALGADSGYLDDFVALIDSPSTNNLKIEFTNPPILAIDVFHLPQFFGRVEKFRSLILQRSTFRVMPWMSHFFQKGGHPILSREPISGGGLQHLIAIPLQHKKPRCFLLGIYFKIRNLDSAWKTRDGWKFYANFLP